MATITANFDGYQIWYYSGFTEFDALIYVYLGKKYVGRMAFYKEGKPIPANFGDPVPSIHFPMSKFNDVINVLREEKPLCLLFSTENMIGCLSTTGNVPVGLE